MADVEKTLQERGARYGEFAYHAVIAQELQDVMRTAETTDLGGNVMSGWAKLTAVQRQALTVIADKIARILSGDPNYKDNWHDIHGYAKLAEDRCIEHDPRQTTLDLAEKIYEAARQQSVASAMAQKADYSGLNHYGPDAGIRTGPYHYDARTAKQCPPVTCAICDQLAGRPLAAELDPTDGA